MNSFFKRTKFCNTDIRNFGLNISSIKAFSTQSKLYADNNNNNDDENELADIEARINDSRINIREAEDDIYDTKENLESNANDLAQTMYEASSGYREVQHEVSQFKDEIFSRTMRDLGAVDMPNATAPRYDHEEYDVHAANDALNYYMTNAERIVECATQTTRIVDESNIPVSDEHMEQRAVYYEEMMSSMEFIRACADDMIANFASYYEAKDDQYRVQHSEDLDTKSDPGSSPPPASSGSSGSLIDDFADVSTEPADYMGGDD